MRGQGRVFQREYRDKRTREVKIAATFTLEYYLDGEMRREASGTTSYTEAVRQLKRRQGEIAQGRRVDPAGDRLTFDQLAAGLVNDYRANGRRTLERVEDAIGHLRATFSGYRARAIDGALVTKYVVDRQTGGAANATVNRELAALKRMYRLAEENLGGYRPTIRMLKEDNVRRGFFERPQFEALLAHFPDDLQPAISTAYITGWRIKSELFSRQRHHVDLEAGWLRLEPGETKNRKGRMFPLVPELHAVLERQLAATRAFQQRTGCVVPWLFHREGQPIRSFRRTWVTACKKAGLSERIPHDFRRTAVRNLERAGVPRSTAMAMVGHRTEAISRRYAIVDEAMLREGAEKLAVFHEAQQPAARVSRSRRAPGAPERDPLRRPVTRPVADDDLRVSARKCSKRMVGWDGIEPPTPGFSVPTVTLNRQPLSTSYVVIRTIASLLLSICHRRQQIELNGTGQVRGKLPGRVFQKLSTYPRGLNEREVFPRIRCRQSGSTSLLFRLPEGIG